MEFIPDAEKAKEFLLRDYFCTYSDAYVVTNEDLRGAMKYMPKNCNRALVIAASGDQPLFCSLYGAKYVDAVDVSYNAKCLTDVKVAAIGCLEYDQYLDLLENLSGSDDVLRVKNMDKISKNLSQTEFEYIRSMRGYKIFGRRVWDGQFDPVLPTEAEYKKLQKIVKKPYNVFISDISSLNTQLTQSYDFMHLSNVLDYVYYPDLRFRVIYNLSKNVNVGGRIVCAHLKGPQWNDTIPLSEFKQHVQMLKDSLKRYSKADEFCKNLLKEEIQETEDMCNVFEKWQYKKIKDERLVIFERVR